ncbi:DUF4421 family protein [Flavobacterium gelatinilyticum]|uniref:DUF4421 family protein n=1 Tax=Flavobacterium gelatinilyticum TaxID=3003260 RepID=UPI0024812A40|nr:DUF4421 family protein [Flavobacterium gelatinilyticum]
MVAKAQIDSSYIKTYPQRIRIMGYISSSFIQITDDNENNYIPNNRLTAGLGFAIKNTIFSFQPGYGFFPLKDNKEYGKSKTMDFQIHNYGRKMILDLFLQNYKGFYTENNSGEVRNIFPDMSVLHIGAEATYLFNNKKFSSKAAFDLNEIQLQSAGSWLLGGGAYFYNLKGIENGTSNSTSEFENLQLGINGGYAYSWRVDEHWLLSGMVKGGANFGNTPKAVSKGKMEVYPTAFGRLAGNYQKNNWGLSMIVIIGNKSVYPIQIDKLTLTTISMQLSFVKHLDNLYKRKK